jgi:pyruvate/2-oxoglutarate dehydrogenase complex dihydrolipoamide acyltransferase (E2) component
MPTAIHVPRINNNDDEVKLVSLQVAVGDRVEAGQLIAEVETDKAVVDVEATAGGFVLAVHGEVDTKLQVGSVLMWLGAQADEAAPAQSAGGADMAATGGAEPTAKARELLRRYGLKAQQVPPSGARLSAADVERHVAAHGLAAADAKAAAPVRSRESRPGEPGQRRELSGAEQGMLHTVSWHRDEAVPGYMEIRYDSAPWDAAAAELQARHQLLLNPVLPLMAYGLARLASATPALNATLAGGARHEYDQVNLGFTVQAGDVLYLAVIRDAARLAPLEFVHRLIDVQRRATSHELQLQELQGATIGFSSMARWKVSRHIPVLAPHTAVMVAHTVDAEGHAVLGATYDHRVLHGAAIAQLLNKLSKPKVLG